MKSAVYIFLVFILMFSHINKLWVLTDFAINQDYISKTFCVNKDKPMLNCNGKCYLAQKLKEQAEKEKKQIPQVLKEKSNVVYIYNYNAANVAYPVTTDSSNKSSIFYAGHISSKHLERIFRPPKESLT